MTGYYLKHCYVLLQFLYARLNKWKQIKRVTNILKLAFVIQRYLLTGIPTNIRFTIRFQLNIFSIFMLCKLARGENKLNQTS